MDIIDRQPDRGSFPDTLERNPTQGAPDGWGLQRSQFIVTAIPVAAIRVAAVHPTGTLRGELPLQWAVRPTGTLRGEPPLRLTAATRI
jgi:hypothetical protein